MKVDVRTCAVSALCVFVAAPEADEFSFSAESLL